MFKLNINYLMTRFFFIGLTEKKKQGKDAFVKQVK